jgi:NTE family protein
MINATSLNSGRNWRFSPTTMGEPPRPPEVADLDKATRFEAPDRYEQLGDHPRDIPLSIAVAASSALPGGMHPMAISEMYPNHRIQLTDGGVHDNQGVQALIDDSCSHALVSDTGGQLSTDEHASPSLLKVLLRTPGILYGRVRQEQLFRLMERPRGEGLPTPLALVHLRRGVPVLLHHYGRTPQPEDEFRVPTDGSSAGFGVHPDVMELLAELRTDLDAFSELESLALIGAAHRTTGDVLTRTGWSNVDDLGEPLAPMTGELPGLDAIAEDLAEAPKEFRRQLKIGGSRFFKPLMLYRWPWWLLIAGVVVGLWFAVRALIDHWGDGHDRLVRDRGRCVGSPPADPGDDIRWADRRFDAHRRAEGHQERDRRGVRRAVGEVLPRHVQSVVPAGGSPDLSISDP